MLSIVGRRLQHRYLFNSTLPDVSMYRTLISHFSSDSNDSASAQKPLTTNQSEKSENDPQNDDPARELRFIAGTPTWVKELLESRAKSRNEGPETRFEKKSKPKFISKKALPGIVNVVKERAFDTHMQNLGRANDVHVRRIESKRTGKGFWSMSQAELAEEIRKYADIVHGPEVAAKMELLQKVNPIIQEKEDLEKIEKFLSDANDIWPEKIAIKKAVFRGTAAPKTSKNKMDEQWPVDLELPEAQWKRGRKLPGAEQKGLRELSGAEQKGLRELSGAEWKRRRKLLQAERKRRMDEQWPVDLKLLGAEQEGEMDQQWPENLELPGAQWNRERKLPRAERKGGMDKQWPEDLELLGAERKRGRKLPGAEQKEGRELSGGEWKRGKAFSFSRYPTWKLSVKNVDDLFSTETLGVFKSDFGISNKSDLKGENGAHSILKTWTLLEQENLQCSIKFSPDNWWDECILWTDEGKLWHFPINNEQGMDKEAQVSFAEHVFLDEHIEDWCPRDGPIRHFMELVMVGLSKNHFITVEEKIENLNWYRDYFEKHRALLEEINALGSFTDPNPTEGTVSE